MVVSVELQVGRRNDVSLVLIVPEYPSRRFFGARQAPFGKPRFWLSIHRAEKFPVAPDEQLLV